MPALPKGVWIGREEVRQPKRSSSIRTVLFYAYLVCKVARVTPPDTRQQTISFRLQLVSVVQNRDGIGIRARLPRRSCEQ